jgi:hypothetical protein
MESALTSDHALALREHNAATAVVASLCERADAAVQRDWGERLSHHKQTGSALPAYGPGYWAIYDPHQRGAPQPSSWRDGWFEWGLRNTSGIAYLDEARGSWVFTAGATLHPHDYTRTAEGNTGWFLRRTADRFAYFWEGRYYRLARVLYPDELLDQTTLEDQGTKLGRWALQAFAALARDPPLY